MFPQPLISGECIVCCQRVAGPPSLRQAATARKRPFGAPGKGGVYKCPCRKRDYPRANCPMMTGVADQVAAAGSSEQRAQIVSRWSLAARCAQTPFPDVMDDRKARQRIEYQRHQKNRKTANIGGEGIAGQGDHRIGPSRPCIIACAGRIAIRQTPWGRPSGLQ